VTEGRDHLGGAVVGGLGVLGRLRGGCRRGLGAGALAVAALTC
jgi:hypothetical protein